MSVYIDTRYMIDTTPAVKIPKNAFGTDFFNSFCFFSDEILYELKDNPNYRLFREHALPATASVLLHAQNSILPALPKNSKLVDLYTNKGNGDIMLLSTILDEQNKELGKLFQSKWIVVTEDNGVIDRAKIYSIDSMNTNEFLDLLKTKDKSVVK